MKNTQKDQKETKHEGFSHPLVKDIGNLLQEDHQRVIPSYQPIQPNNTNRISSKIVRCSFLPNTNLKEFIMQVSPFNCNTSTLPIVESMVQCSYCGSKITPFSQIENHTVMNCFFCNKSSQVGTNATQNKEYFGIKTSQNCSTQVKPKKICFIFQASQYVYEAKMNKSVFSCLQALREDNIEVSFILYDNDYVMFVNPLSLQLTKVKIQAGEIEKETIEMPIEELFIDVKEDLSALEQLIESILYEGYYIKETKLKETSQIVSQIMPKHISKTYFISTIGQIFSNGTPESQLTSIGNKLKQYQNNISDLLSQKPIKNTATSHTSFALCPNSRFFIVPYNVTYQQAITSLGYTLQKIYKVKQVRSIQNELYYDLFNLLVQEQKIETQFNIKCPKNIQMATSTSSVGTLFGNLQITKQKSNDKVNRYTIKVKKANSSFALLLHFKTIPNISTSRPLVQFQYQQCQDNQLQKLILNVIPFKGQTILQSYDDQLIFKYHMHQGISDWNGSSYKQLRTRLFQKYGEVIWMLQNYSTTDSISFPKSWKHYMLHSFVLDSQIGEGTLNSYLMFQMVTHNLETLAKRLYYRCYKIEGGEVKNIRNGVSLFEKYSCIFVENGKELMMVLSDPSVQEIKNIFGHFESVPCLSRMYQQLPNLPTNQSYRKAIETIRCTWDHNFLPLKIIDSESYIFTQQIEPHLYKKQDHKLFLRKLWRNG